MKSIHFLFLLAILTLSFCLEQNEKNYKTEITFSKEGVKITKEEVIVEEGNVVVIEQPGSFYVTGEGEGFIVIRGSSVKLYLENLKLSSTKNAPIIFLKDLNDVEIINLKNTELIDLEEKGTEGECAVIKIKKNSIVSFKNDDTFTLEGNCKNIIKGVSNSTIIFQKSDGEYKINSRKTAIDSDGLLQFNGGTFTIESKDGDAIRSLPDESDTVSLGKILINDGTFNIHCYNDAITAKNNITIMNGKFNIITEEGFDSETYNETESSKGFKLTSSEEGKEIKIYNGEFDINTADDALRSNRDITIEGGKFVINSKDDAICAKFNLVLGKRGADNKNLDIKILNSYEALEGMTVSIYSGKILVTAEDDGINASGEKAEEPWERPGRNRTNRNWTNPWGDGGFPWGGDPNDPNRTNPWGDGGFPWGGDQNGTNPWQAMFFPNDSYWIAIYGGELDLITNSDGIDSNGHIYIHGGKINIFSEGTGPNEPIDHNGNFSLFNTEILGVGTRGIEMVHRGIHKGNQMYAFYSGVISKDKELEILDEQY